MPNQKVIVLLCAFFCCCQSYKILAVFPVPFHSHYTIASTILKELAKKGHEVTVATPFLQKIPIPNFREISLKSLVEVMDEQKQHLFDLEQQTVAQSAKFLTNMGYLITEKTLQTEEIQKLLKSKEKFDLVILPQFLNEALLGISHHFKAPTVLIASMPLFPWSSFLLAHPSASSYVPNLLTAFTGHMNFWQRLTNSFWDAYTILYHQWVILPKHKELVRKWIPGAPDLYQFLNNVSMVLINSHISTYDAVPRVPNSVEVGGLHIKPAGQLPEDLKKFLDDSPDGAIIFSMGSNLRSSSFPQEKRDAFLNVFAGLKQKVLWKWEDDQLAGVPKNVKLMKWLPQSDILAHPNIRAFISHGGLLSTMESVYHGVPVVGIPIFSDQKMNMAKAVSAGYALVVPFQTLSQETLASSLEDILENPTYRTNAQKRSKIMKDQAIPPLDHAIFWIEYIARHEGAPHLRYAGLNLWWYQRNLLDIVTFIVTAAISLIVVIYFSFKKMGSKSCSRKHVKRE